MPSNASVLMEACRSFGGSRLRSSRKALADLTNSSSLSLSTISVPVKPKPKPKVSLEHSSIKSSDSSAGSSEPKNVGDLETPESTALAKGISSSGFVTGRKRAISKRGTHSAVNLKYVREKRADASFTTALSCPPVRRTQKHRNYSVMEHDMNQNASCSEPCQKNKKKQRCSGKFVDDGIPLQDFIRKQRAYFAEVDSFELPEEVVSESEFE